MPGTKHPLVYLGFVCLTGSLRWAYVYLAVSLLCAGFLMLTLGSAQHPAGMKPAGEDSPLSEARD